MTRVSAFLVAVAAFLVAAFVAAPGRLAASPDADFTGYRQLNDGVREAFVGYWRSGDGGFPPQLRAIVDYWFRYHLVKAVVAGLLLVVFTALAVRCWKGVARAGRPVPAVGGVVATVLALFSLAVTMANVQGMAAPFASLLPMLVDGPAADADLAGVLDEVRAPGAATPALDVMTDDFARYHAVMAVIATVVAVAFVALGVLLWRRFRAAERTTRRVSASLAVLAAVVALAAVVLAVANSTTAADAGPALLALFEGSW